MPAPLARFSDANGHEYQYDEELGIGGQAVVWKVTRLHDRKGMAVKLFKSTDTPAERSRQEERLSRVCETAQRIASSLPEAQVCFPRAIHKAPDEFGVLMDLATGRSLTHSSLLVNPLDQPEKYISEALSSVMAQRFQYHHFLLAAFHLCRVIDVIHRHGMTHCDLSLANIFLDPADGRICLIDCDNLACDGYLPVKVAGTPGFRAPELIGDSPVTPSPVTDRHSLAVLVFYLTMLRHPLVGNTGGEWNPSFKSEEEAFGARAVFTDHPAVPHNRFNGGLPFDFLPESLRAVLVKAFTVGLTAADERPKANVLARELWQALECMTFCEDCGQRFFLTDAQASCLFCGTENMRPRWRLVFSNGQQMLIEHGRKLYEHHVRGQDYVFTTALAEAKVWQGEAMMRNVGSETWTLQLTNGSELPCEPGKAFKLGSISQIKFGPVRTARILKA